MLDSVNAIYLGLFLVCLLLCAFFSSSETAFISVPKIRIKHLASTGAAGAKRVARLIDQPNKLLATILVGNNLVMTAAAALGTIVAVSIFGAETAILIATITVTILLLIFGEIAPKTIAIQHAERMAFLYARPLQLVSFLLYPIASVLGWIASGLTRIIAGTPVPKSLVSEEEIHNIISVGVAEGAVEEAEAKMVDRVFRFGDRLVNEVMTPRPDIVWLETGTTLAHFLSIYTQSPHSHFPIYEESIDNVIGIISIKDVLMAQAKASISSETSINQLTRPAYFVPETKPISDLFADMQARARRMAVIIDEFGGTAGIVTLEQLVGEIVGELGEELIQTEKEFETIDEKTFQIDGGMRIDQANEELGLDLPTGNYETVAGFVLNVLGHIPKPGERLKYNGLMLVITQMRGAKIEKIRITRN